MVMKEDFKSYETAWCPGCGNFSILDCLKDALARLEKRPHEILFVSGIGQAAKTPQYVYSNMFNGLHGRALPPAIAAKIANKDLTVIVTSGDGDTYGEGGNHFIHNIRRNVNIAHFVHNNQIYGLTKGQASPTTEEGHKTGVQTLGVMNMPFNPLAVAISLDAGFVSRGFTGEKEHLISLMMEAIKFPGYALVDILQPCITFNKVNTFKWYKERVKPVADNHDPGDRVKAFELSLKWGDEIPIGIYYKHQKPDFHSKIPWLSKGPPLVDREVPMEKLQNLISEFI
jgi:2-oxoglutarate ferredoxin oxidoreductase subunit beta